MENSHHLPEVEPQPSQQGAAPKVAVGDCCLESMKLLGLLQGMKLSFSVAEPAEVKSLVSRSTYQRTPILFLGERRAESFLGILHFLDSALLDDRLNSCTVKQRVRFFDQLEQLDLEIFKPLIEETFLPLPELPKGCSRLTKMIQWWSSEKIRTAKAFAEMKGSRVSRAAGSIGDDSL